MSRCADVKGLVNGTFIGDVEGMKSEDAKGNEQFGLRCGPDESNLIIPIPPHSESVVGVLLISTAADTGWVGWLTKDGFPSPVRLTISDCP